MLPFFNLDIEISLDNNKFEILVYCQLIFSDGITNFESFIRNMYKLKLLQILPDISFRLSWNFDNFHGENRDFEINAHTKFIPKTS